MADSYSTRHESRYAKRADVIYSEQAKVAEFEAQGDAGRDELRLWRVAAYVTRGAFSNKPPEVQLETINALIPLAVAADEKLDKTPNSKTDTWLEEQLGGRNKGQPIALAALALPESFAPKGKRVHVMSFLRTYHELLARRLITPTANEYYESLMQIPAVRISLRSGRQHHSSIIDH